MRFARNKILAAFVAFATSILGACHSKPQEVARQPRNTDVVLITLDTTRADHLGCYGSRSVKTPNLDALAARGVRFAHATAQVPLTLPSHACIMTGSYPEVNGMRGMGGFTLAKSHPTIASVAHAAGYQTAAFVASRVLSRTFGLSNGFDTYDDQLNTETREGQLPNIYPKLPASVETDRAIGWLKQHSQKKFFLWVHYYDAHAPYDPPEPYKHLYASHPYSGEIAYMDSQVGRLLDDIGEQGIGSRTLIVVIADHGEGLGEHGEMTHGIFLYDSTMHVPLIIAGPGIPAGKVIEEEVRSIDIMPTILAFLNLSPGKEAEGVSLWPLIQKGQRVQSDFAYMETLYPRIYMGWSELRGIRTDQWKYILAPHQELYDVEKDPGERKNVISRFPDVASNLNKGIWYATRLKSPEQNITASPISEQTRKELESLGYVSGGQPETIELGTPAPDPKNMVGMLKLLSEAGTAIEGREYHRAVPLMKRGLQIDPRNPLAHVYLAIAYERMGDFKDAIGIYQHALSLKLATDEIYARLGKDYLRIHDLPKAVDAMTRANEINPTRLDNLDNLGTAEMQLGRMDEAEKAFHAVVLQDNHDAAAWNGLGLIEIQRGDAATAHQDFEKAIAADSNAVEPLLNLGLLYKNAGDNQQAIHYFRLFLSKAPRAQYGSMFGKVNDAIREMEAH